MTGLGWLGLALILTGVGVAALTLARHRHPKSGPDSHAGPRTGHPEGGSADPPVEDLFTANVEATRDNVAAHWRNLPSGGDR